MNDSSNVNSVEVLNKPIRYREGVLPIPSPMQGDISIVAMGMGEPHAHTDIVGVKVTVDSGDLLDTELSRQEGLRKTCSVMTWMMRRRPMTRGVDASCYG